MHFNVQVDNYSLMDNGARVYSNADDSGFALLQARNSQAKEQTGCHCFK